MFFSILAALLLSSVCSLIPTVRHYDFISSPTLNFSPFGIILKFRSLNETYYTLELQRNEYLVHAGSVLKVHDPLTGRIHKSSIVSHAYHGKVIVDDRKVGSARILFHDELSLTMLML
jgi:hypothetical protein